MHFGCNFFPDAESFKLLETACISNIREQQIFSEILSSTQNLKKSRMESSRRFANLQTVNVNQEPIPGT